MAQHIGATVQSGCLAVPDSDHPVVFAALRGRSELRSLDDIRGEFLVDTGPKYDGMLVEKRLGIAESDLMDSGIRILKLDVIHPLDQQEVQKFSTDLEEVLVIEEKRAFIELAVKDALYGIAGSPRVLGKIDEDRRPFLRADSDLPPEFLAGKIAQRVRKVLSSSQIERFVLEPTIPKSPFRLDLPMLARTPYFCSGCPHNRSTVVPDGSLVGAGIGCHAIATMMPEER